MSVLPDSPFDGIAFVDPRAVEWPRVARTRFFFYQRFAYQYPGPIRDLRQRLIVMPAGGRRDQRVCGHQVRILPAPALTRQRLDRYGNVIFECVAPLVEERISFEVITTVERVSVPEGAPSIALDRANEFTSPTRLTAADGAIAEVARDLRERHPDPHQLAAAISDWVARALRYAHGATDVGTTAAEALQVGRGVCQDYAHLMLAICRAIGLPARYVSGHLLGEGGSHAWVEVLLPHGAAGRLGAAAFDPTNRRRPNLSYITVAVGRDYRDVAPTSGTFTAPYGGRLTFSKKAGLTEVQYA